MKVDSVKNNRRALFALLLCSGFIASHPLTVFASSNEVQATQQQNLTVSGVVKDNAGEPVIGASIAVKGGTTGTISDIDGKFSLNVAKGAILEVSFIGYKTQEFKIDSSKSLNIVLKDTSRIAPFATFKENFPSISDIVPVVPPLTAILAPITGSPALSFTTPDTVKFCC
jgi:hypothetical protein